MATSSHAGALAQLLGSIGGRPLLQRMNYGVSGTADKRNELYA